MKPKIVTINVNSQRIRDGVREDPNYCPIALALTVQGFDVDTVDVNDLIFDDKSGNVIELSTPKKLSTFISRFDDGKKVKPFSFRVQLPLTIPAKLL